MEINVRVCVPDEIVGGAFIARSTGSNDIPDLIPDFGSDQLLIQINELCKGRERPGERWSLDFYIVGITESPHVGTGCSELISIDSGCRCFCRYKDE